MNYLEKFITIGHWCLDENFKSNKSLTEENLKGINFKIDKQYNQWKDVVYIFKSADEIFYIGETTSGVYNRFASYRYGFDKVEDTDNRVKREITNRLINGEQITIHIWQPKTNFEISNEIIEIPISKPIEEFLIHKLSTKYNLINNKGNITKQKSSFQERMSYEGGTYTPPNGIPSMSREEALRILGFDEDKK